VQELIRVGLLSKVRDIVLPDFVRAGLYTLLIGLSIYFVPPLMTYIQAQTVVGQAILQPGGGVGELVNFGLREGPAALVVLIILFFYRRDYKQVVDFWQEQTKTTVALVKESTQQHAEASAALKENSIVMHGLKRAIEGRFDIKVASESGR